MVPIFLFSFYDLLTSLLYVSFSEDEKINAPIKVFIPEHILALRYSSSNILYNDYEEGYLRYYIILDTY
jgi:hypothetical protein